MAVAGEWARPARAAHCSLGREEDKRSVAFGLLRATLALVIYSAFIARVSYDSARAGHKHPDWYRYSVPASFTLRRRRLKAVNRLIATVLSAAIFYWVLWLRGDESVFVEKGVVWGYAMVLVSAFSRDAANVCLNVVAWSGTKLRVLITMFQTAFEELRDP
jgi:hypothetical protein